MHKIKVVAIIQARMGSSRLPGKVLMPLAGKPVLWHIVHRLRKCRTVDVIAIATSERSSDDPIKAFADTEGVLCVRGPEDNVLQRFAVAAGELDPDVIVRVTGDAPLVDPITIDVLVTRLIQENADYCVCDPAVATIHEGFCPFSRNALNRILSHAASDPVAVEHITAYIKEHPQSFNIVHVPVPPEHRFEHARMSIDTPADLMFMEEVHRRLDASAGEVDISSVVGLLHSFPELLDINGHIYQKKATDQTVTAVVRCDGDSRIGMGHVFRCLAIADELREKQGCGIVFAVGSGEHAISLVRRAGFPVENVPLGVDENEWLSSFLKSRRADIIILDIRNDLRPDAVRRWRATGTVVVTIDDPSDRRIEADIAFYPPAPQVREFDWTDFRGKLYAGWEWIPLRRQFAGVVRSTKGIPPELLVTMGGSDPSRFTLSAVSAVLRSKLDVRLKVIVGPSFLHGEELSSLLANSTLPYLVVESPLNMAKAMATADLALASFGVTAYELAALGIPAVYMCLSPDHARSASVFVEAGIGLSLGCPDELSEKEIVENLKLLVNDEEKRRKMGEKAGMLVDGRGALRIAEAIMGQVS